MLIRRLGTAVAMSAALASPTAAQQMTIDFEGLPAELGPGVRLGHSYMGLDWAYPTAGGHFRWTTAGNPNWSVRDPITCHDGQTCAHNERGLDAALASTTPGQQFTFGGWFRRAPLPESYILIEPDDWLGARDYTGSFGAANVIALDGFLNGTFVGRTELPLDEIFRWVSIPQAVDELRMSGGGGMFLVDDLTINLVPEPGLGLLLAPSVVTLLLVTRYRHRRGAGTCGLGVSPPKREGRSAIDPASAVRDN